MKNDKASKRKAKYGSILGGNLPGGMPKGKKKQKWFTAYELAYAKPLDHVKFRTKKLKLKAKGGRKGTGY